MYNRKFGLPKNMDISVAIFGVILHHVNHDDDLYYNKVDIRMQCHFTITLIYLQSFWYINKTQ